jgi:hypothetical protein
MYSMGRSINASRESEHGASTTSTDNATPHSESRMVKEGWGSRSNFQASYGLAMTPEDLEKGMRS